MAVRAVRSDRASVTADATPSESAARGVALWVVGASWADLSAIVVDHAGSVDGVCADRSLAEAGRVDRVR